MFVIVNKHHVTLPKTTNKKQSFISLFQTSSQTPTPIASHHPILQHNTIIMQQPPIFLLAFLASGNPSPPQTHHSFKLTKPSSRTRYNQVPDHHRPLWLRRLRQRTNPPNLPHNLHHNLHSPTHSNSHYYARSRSFSLLFCSFNSE